MRVRGRHERNAERFLLLALGLLLGLSFGCSSHILLGVSDEADASDGAPRPADASTAGDAGNVADAGTSPDGAGGDPCGDYANLLCELEASCNLLVFRNTWWGDLAICKERRKLRCLARLTAPSSNETPERMNACVASLSKYTCDDYADEQKLREMCDGAPGNLADGAPCGVGAQCRGQGCFPADNARCGVCSTLSPLGAPCNASCYYGLHCISNTCTAFLREGDVCRFGGPLCAFGLACIGAGSGQGRCGKRLGLGAACDPRAFECNDAQGLTCDDATSRCQPDPGWPAVGAPCSSGQFCRADAWCNTGSNRCEARRREGEPCGSSSAGAVCLQPAVCVGGTCMLPNPSECR